MLLKQGHVFSVVCATVFKTTTSAPITHCLPDAVAVTSFTATLLPCGELIRPGVNCPEFVSVKPGDQGDA